MSSKALLDINRWTPDSVVIDQEHDHHYYFGSASHGSSSSHNFNEDNNNCSSNSGSKSYLYHETDDINYDNDDVFDRQSVYNNYHSVFHRTASNRIEEDNLEEFESNFYEDDNMYNSNFDTPNTTENQENFRGNFPSNFNGLQEGPHENFHGYFPGSNWSHVPSGHSVWYGDSIAEIGEKRRRELDGGNFVNKL